MPTPEDELPGPGEYLRKKREAMGLSTENVADELAKVGYKVDRTRLFRIEKGERPMPDELFGVYIQALRRIARRHAEAVGLKVQAETGDDNSVD